jgi:enolase
MIIKRVKAKKIKNSRGEDTLKVTIKSDVSRGTGAAPSGMSTGKHEVMAFPEEGVDFCVDFINKELSKKLVGLQFQKYSDLKKIESLIDIKKYGGNTLIAVEYAILNSYGNAWEFVDENSKQVPRPVGNVIGGGAHVRSDKVPDFQEFLVLSLNCPNFVKAMEANYRVHSLVQKKFKKLKKFNNETSDEGAWIANISNIEALDILHESVKEISRDYNFVLHIGLDVAASSFYKDGKYYYKNYSNKEKEKVLTSAEQIKFIGSLIEKYGLKYVEDPLHEDDFEGFAKLSEKYSNKCLIVGDDLITTNLDRLKEAVKLKSVNSVIVKPNQIGSLLKTKKVVEFAKKNKLFCVMSHRSGETLDATISHLAVGLETPLLKTGISGLERESKLQEVRKIVGQIKAKIAE